MNEERIDELAEQAFQSINDISTEGVADRYTFEQAWFQMYNQKFAELIVQECCQMMLDLEVKYPANLTVREIKQHFGVEE